MCPVKSIDMNGLQTVPCHITGMVGSDTVLLEENIVPNSPRDK